MYVCVCGCVCMNARISRSELTGGQCMHDWPLSIEMYGHTNKRTNANVMATQIYRCIPKREKADTKVLGVCALPRNKDSLNYHGLLPNYISNINIYSYTYKHFL